MRSLAVNITKSNEIEKEYAQELSKMDVKQLVKELFSYLDYTEESESGRIFHPISIGSCRALISPCLDMTIKELRKKINE